MNNITVILGENGKGKTRYLANYFEKHRDHESIAVISNSPNNQIFPPYSPQRGRHYNYNLSRIMGFSIARRVSSINNYLFNLMLSEDSINDIFYILNHIGFDDAFSIRKRCRYTINKVRERNTNNERYILTPNKIKENTFPSYNNLSGRIIGDSIVEKYRELFIDHGEDNFIFLRNNYQITYQSYLKRLELEKELKSLIGNRDYNNLFTSEFFFSKDGFTFPISDASSGELYIISLGLFVKDFLKREGNNKIKSILIDEPENSLHPRWQKEYIPFLKGFISYHNANVIIATHSPFIAMENNDYHDEISIFSIDNGVLNKLNHHKNDNNIEQVYYELFGILTPKNRYLSDYCNNILKNFSMGKISYNQAKDVLNSMIHASFDAKQKQFIGSVVDLLDKLDGGKIESI